MLLYGTSRNLTVLSSRSGFNFIRSTLPTHFLLPYTHDSVIVLCVVAALNFFSEVK